MGEIPKLTPEQRLDRVEQLAEIAAPLKALSETDGWRILKQTFERQRQSYFDKLAKSLMDGAEIDQRKLDYNRGFFESVEDLLEAPENAEKILKRAAEKLAKTLEDESKE